MRTEFPHNHLQQAFNTLARQHRHTHLAEAVAEKGGHGGIYWVDGKLEGEVQPTECLDGVDHVLRELQPRREDEDVRAACNDEGELAWRRGAGQLCEVDNGPAHVGKRAACSRAPGEADDVEVLEDGLQQLFGSHVVQHAWFVWVVRVLAAACNGGTPASPAQERKQAA